MIYIISCQFDLLLYRPIFAKRQFTNASISSRLPFLIQRFIGNIAANVALLFRRHSGLSKHRLAIIRLPFIVASVAIYARATTRVRIRHTPPDERLRYSFSAQECLG